MNDQQHYRNRRQAITVPITDSIKLVRFRLNHNVNDSARKMASARFSVVKHDLQNAPQQIITWLTNRKLTVRIPALNPHQMFRFYLQNTEDGIRTYDDGYYLLLSATHDFSEPDYTYLGVWVHADENGIP